MSDIQVYIIIIQINNKDARCIEIQKNLTRIEENSYALGSKNPKVQRFTNSKA